MLLIGSGDERPAPRTWVTHGRASFSGPGDAALAVSARHVEVGVALRIEWTDDVTVPVPREAQDAAFVAADHLEVWLVPRPEGRDPRKARPVQLGVGRRADRSLDVRWLHGTGPDVSVSAADGGVEILLSKEFLGPGFYWQVHHPHDGGWPEANAWTSDEATWLAAQATCCGQEVGWQAFRFASWPLTVAFSDSDDPDAGQQTLLATSELTWGDPYTFGLLMRLPGDARYPVLLRTRRLPGAFAR